VSESVSQLDRESFDLLLFFVGAGPLAGRLHSDERRIRVTRSSQEFREPRPLLPYVLAEFDHPASRFSCFGPSPMRPRPALRCARC
jgi:hypothetical protein